MSTFDFSNSLGITYSKARMGKGSSQGLRMQHCGGHSKLQCTRPTQRARLLKHSQRTPAMGIQAPSSQTLPLFEKLESQIFLWNLHIWYVDNRLNVLKTPQRQTKHVCRLYSMYLTYCPSACDSWNCCVLTKGNI